MAQQQNAPAGALASIRSITVWLEDENGVKRPRTYDSAHCVLGGLQGGVPVARVLNDAGELVDYYNATMQIVQVPTGLVAPGGSGGRIVQPT